MLMIPVVLVSEEALRLVMLAEDANSELNLLVVLPKFEKAEPARIFPVKVEKAPWTVRFCWRVVFPVVVESPKFVTSFDI